MPPSAIANQINPSGVRPYVAQFNFGQLIGNVQTWNPNCSSEVVKTFLNSALRETLDRRNWYSNMTRGQIVTPKFYSAGTVAVTLGSSTVVGSGTAFTPDMIGRSLRIGYN